MSKIAHVIKIIVIMIKY